MLTALIPAHNDAYALRFCLASIVGHVGAVHVLDDASTDHTPDVVLDAARRHPHVHYHRHQGTPLGWIEARNRLLAMTDANHLLFLDADDVLCEYNADVLGEMVQGDSHAVRLWLTEMWGDLYHTTQRLRHYDRCHLYVDRRRMRDFCWSGGSAARPETSVSPARSDGPLIFHLKGVKPDARLVERRLMRRWLRGKLDVVPAEAVARMSPAETHRRAVRILLDSAHDGLRPTYRGTPSPAAPDRPVALREALPGRFRIIYRDGTAVDRVDRMDGDRSRQGV